MPTTTPMHESYVVFSERTALSLRAARQRGGGVSSTRSLGDSGHFGGTTHVPVQPSRLPAELLLSPLRAPPLSPLVGPRAAAAARRTPESATGVGASHSVASPSDAAAVAAAACTEAAFASRAAAAAASEAAATYAAAAVSPTVVAALRLRCGFTQLAAVVERHRLTTHVALLRWARAAALEGEAQKREAACAAAAAAARDASLPAVEALARSLASVEADVRRRVAQEMGAAALRGEEFSRQLAVLLSDDGSNEKVGGGGGGGVRGEGDTGRRS